MELNIIAVLVFAYLGLAIGKFLDVIVKATGDRYNCNFWFHFAVIGALYPLT